MCERYSGRDTCVTELWEGVTNKNVKENVWRRVVSNRLQMHTHIIPNAIRVKDKYPHDLPW